MPPIAPKGKMKGKVSGKNLLVLANNLASKIVDIPQDIGGQVKEIDYVEACKLYSDYWFACTESYIPNIGHKFEISIGKLGSPPQNLNIRELEEQGVMKTMNYLLNIFDPDKNMTLYVYPQKVKVKPNKFEAMKDGMFWMVNG